MRRIQLVVFDIARITVSDRSNAVIAIIHAFRKRGNDLAVEEVNEVIEPRRKDVIKNLLEQFTLSHVSLGDKCNNGCLYTKAAEKLSPGFIIGSWQKYRL
jgi:hypothetical protein